MTIPQVVLLMSSSNIDQPISADREHPLQSNVTMEKPSSNSKFVNIRFTIALSVPAGKFSFEEEQKKKKKKMECGISFDMKRKIFL